MSSTTESSPPLITILRGVPDKKRPNVLVVEVHCATEEIRARLDQQIDRRREKNRLKRLLREFVIPPKSERDRDGELEPQVPRRLREALQDKANSLGPRRQTSLLRKALAQWIDFDAGVRRTHKVNGKQRRRRPRGEFVERARVLGREPDKVRFTFNAGTSKARNAILSLLEARDLTQSEFFSALIELVVTST